ncbi:hypothetical protein N8649_02340 [bacterium]|nr:hypothetical protein [bacterium]
MESLVDSTRWWTRAKLVKARRKLIMARTPWVLGRIACLGRDVHKLVGGKLPLVNIQKGRVDLLLDHKKKPQLRPNTASVAPYFERRDIIPLVAQQEAFTWPLKHPPEAIFMDSFSELTDQLFINRATDKSFCANYSDIKHTEKFSQRYECNGLLQKEVIETCYRAFFTAVRKDFGRIPIIYLHFPIDLEKREKYQLRHKAIVDAINIVAADFASFHLISADAGIVHWPDSPVPEHLENFPYHYNSATYANLAEKVKALNISL